ncbi:MULTISPECIES: hypothetical protein [unclassified Microcoleus]|uniref:hypothetical protein n=1 Tax=unclassified Microcoleus TaxID=2642155 RepID=UPI0025EE181F|nr:MULTISPECIES: hypothetical protein [unclassified Microcoleus]
MLGVEVGCERVFGDRDRITGGDLTAGIDFGLILASKFCDEETAKIIQYFPNPNSVFSTKPEFHRQSWPGG